MTLRCPKPLSQGDWERLMENLENGPTPKQIEIMKEAEKWSKHTSVPDAIGSD